MEKKSDWIDELENEEDDKTFFQQLTSAIYKSRMGWSYWWPVLIAQVQDDEMTTERGLFSAKDSNEETKKRVNREK